MVKEIFWANKKVLVTGHTGFKGSWLCLLLNELNAKVYGYSLNPESEFSMFEQLGINNFVENKFADIRDLNILSNYISEVKPDIIIHMAAQAFVRKSYIEPILTWETNTIGTLNLLEAAKNLVNTCSIVVVTTDKVYENNEWVYAYRENDLLGGFDPYSASKAAAELLVSSWRNSFGFKYKNLKIATARAGNVIGGGDWSQDRIIPDIIRALAIKNTIKIRNPLSIRPWQHVIEPLSGYLSLSKKIYLNTEDNHIQSAFNFGPNLNNSKNVTELVENVLKIWPGSWEIINENNILHETKILNVTIDKAQELLSWKPKWDFETSVRKTVEWYQKFYNSDDILQFTKLQILDYFKDNVI